MAASGELALWRRVVQQHLEEACGCVIGESDHPQRRALAIRQARAWFLGNGADFHTVCLLAELDPARVRRLALEAMAATADSSKADRQPPKEAAHA